MTTTLARDTDRIRESLARVEARRAGEPGWLRDQRRAALARFEAVGFPRAKDEDWRQTNVSRLAGAAWAPASPEAARAPGLERLFPAKAAGARLVFVNGAFAPELSTTTARPGVVTTTLAAAARGEHAALVRAHLGRIALEGTPFSLLNAALFEDAALVLVGAGQSVEEPIELVQVATVPGEPASVLGRALVLLEPDARATLVERFLAPLDDVYFANAVTHVALAPGASLDHTRLEQESARAVRVALLSVELAQGSHYAGRNVTLGAGLAREDARVRLAGEGAVGSLDGLVVLADRQHADHQTRIEHASPRCRSRQEHRSVVAAHARSVFRGRIVVRPGAQRTEAEQSSRNLLLSDDAAADTSPELEIHADDVKCAHGATVGRLPEEALFYMRSRGIDPGAARAVLTYAFASEVVERARDERVRGLLEDAVRASLCPGERHIRALEHHRVDASLEHASLEHGSLEHERGTP